MARKKSLFNLELWDNAATIIGNLPEKQKAEKMVSIKEGLSRIKASIDKAKKMGYTNEEIIKILKTSGIVMSLATFKENMKKKTHTQTNIQSNIKNKKIKNYITTIDNNRQKIGTVTTFSNDDTV